ncbi:efflux RND transporter permease subunit [Bradyrhizobium sp. U87765 SZCCT0131]|uniref:efflux RND transporter permease subunit n=1 Tax=unclassified Bradyrhizobium TaxID=2631580 RepID=UPI001BAD4645|nr:MULTISPECIES: efflux RND transporter permease subunit [unclassified Bradyrhizobium]MBR1219124.1 efflux RND transporter permease subunit [Bradyrhizobium sp. U87765 SZCCT0131]MBR1261775.1 efflux RND transporter permease subunit [Bradyrhizobium sp. U87765 SZCCT0134]MBR1306372.1 efflux RND transporter permease subunit [Bradyrhizobium sp. U87765 SZCCT0110]MBR1317557.1 efflux RND transporter permease subunit [Bradyrhizobium sp. U87765 SZCCT0109]MBR1351259.1 efflux RND transporter permease subunit
MIKSLIEFGLTRSAIIVLGLAVFCAAGIVAFSKLNIEAYPNPAPVILEITAQAPGLSAEEMEKYYTIPMEVGLYPTPGVVNIRSTSFYGLSFVRVTFRYGVDYYFALTQAANSIQQNITLPNNLVPTIQQSSLVGEIYRYELVGPPNFGLTNLRTLQDYVVARRLMTIPGVVQINAWGGTTKQFSVEADLQKLEAYNITVPQLVQALGNANINVGGREIAIGQQSVNIRGIGLIDSGGADDVTQGYRVRDIENVVLTQSAGLPIQIKDVAKVTVGSVPRLGIAGRDKDNDVAAAIVVMGRTQHTNDIIPKVEEEVAKLNSDGSLPPGVKIVNYYDRSSLVNVTTHTVLHNLIFGCILVFMIQWIFLGDLRSALIVSANIPFALFFAIIILVLQGEDANLLSLGAVDFGIIVDSAVIMMENIFRNFQSAPENRLRVLKHLAEGYWGPDPTSKTGGDGSTPAWTDRLRMIFVSALQVDKAVFFTAAITVTAFVPLFTMQGVEGQIFGPMARTYGYALAGALLATFTVTPVLASLLMKHDIEEVETFIVRKLRAFYTPVLRWSLDHAKIAVAAGGIFLALSGLCASRLGSEFLPALEEGNFWIRAAMPPTMSLDAGKPYVAKMREILLRHPEVITVVSQHGRPDNGSDASAFSNVELFAPIKPFDQWPKGLTKEKLTEELQQEFAAELPGVEFNFSQYIQDNVEEALSGVKGANSVKVIGPNLEMLEKLAVQIEAEMAKVNGVADLGIFRLLGQPNLNIRIDREKAARYGLNTGDVNTVVQAALAGTSATTVLEGDRTFGVVVRLDPKFRTSIDAVRDIKVAYQTPAGTNAYIPLSELATISLDTGASFIYRERSQRYIPIKFSVRGRDLGSTVAEAQQRVTDAVQLPSGYRLIWSGEFDNLQAAKARLVVVVPITLLLIFVLLYGLFNSMRDSLLALAGIPFAIGGGLIALYLAGLDFSISAAIGFISLFGVAVMDGILNITYFRELRASGMSIAEAVFNGSEQRMRPMLMTALSAGVGLFPAALSHGIGSQVQRPLATVVVGGMFIGPLLLLVVAPALRKIFLSRDASAHREPAAAPPEAAH